MTIASGRMLKFNKLIFMKTFLTIPSWMNMPVKARVLQTSIFVFSFPMFTNLIKK